MLIAEFRSSLRILYKPRDLAVDVHFQELLSWLNERGDHPPSGYSRSCTWALRMGGVRGREPWRRPRRWALLPHARWLPGTSDPLDATDFHFENLIAAGEQPVLIDLEALFHPRRRSGDPDQTGQLADEAMAQLGPPRRAAPAAPLGRGTVRGIGPRAASGPTRGRCSPSRSRAGRTRVRTP